MSFMFLLMSQFDWLIQVELPYPYPYPSSCLYCQLTTLLTNPTSAVIPIYTYPELGKYAYRYLCIHVNVGSPALRSIS